MEIAGMNFEKNILDNIDKVFSGKSLDEIIKDNLAQMDAEIENVVNEEIEKRAQAKYEQMMASLQPTPQDKKDFEGLRRITVYYDPKGDADDPDYVKVEVEPESDEEGMNDTVAMLLATAKHLSNVCPAVDEGGFGTALLCATQKVMTETVLNQLIGGALNDRN